jgi:hypothetical protein
VFSISFSIFGILYVSFSQNHRTQAPLEIHPEPEALFIRGQAEHEKRGGIGAVTSKNDCICEEDLIF